MLGMPDHDRLERFADLVVRVGANVQPGSFVLLRTDIAHLDIARAVVERAYVAGASWVEVDWSDGPIRRSQVTHADIERLTRTRPWVMERTRAWAAERGVSIALVGDPDPHLLDDADPVKAAAFPVDEALAFREALFEQQLRWTVVAAPNRGWAHEVFGEPDLERLWEAVATAMRLDEADPVTSWRERAAQLAARARALNALDLTEVRYRSADTDLTVGLVPNARWTGGAMDDPDGVTYMPNIPTEEVFTSPDRRRADGVISLTKPVIIGGLVVEGLKVSFRGGRITDITAASSAETVRLSSTPTKAPAASARSRSLTGTRGSPRPACSSITCCSMRTPPATSRGARASRSRWRAACPRATRRGMRSASTARPYTPMS